METVRRVAQVMGMPVSLAMRGRHAGTLEGESAWAEVVATLRDVDRALSPFRPDSYVSRLDRGEVDLAACPAELHEVLALGEQWRVESAGAFDVRRDGHLDPNGVVKGWAVERAARPLRHLVDTDFCLSAGGDLVAEVCEPSRPEWRIGIEDPYDPTLIVATVQVRHGAVATSGLAWRGGHITDPRTGTVPGALASVTVIAESLTVADLDATAAFAQGESGAAWLKSRGRSGLVVRADRSCEVLDGRLSAV